jgi:predicted MFS family arabinose efflux permease
MAVKTDIKQEPAMRLSLRTMEWDSGLAGMGMGTWIGGFLVNRFGVGQPAIMFIGAVVLVLAGVVFGRRQAKKNAE